MSRHTLFGARRGSGRRGGPPPGFLLVAQRIRYAHRR
jgi:hypothetical protein